MDEDSNLLPIQTIDGEAETRISVISSTDPKSSGTAHAQFTEGSHFSAFHYSIEMGMVPSIIDVWGYDREFSSSDSTPITQKRNNM